MSRIKDPNKKLEYDRVWRKKNIQKVRDSALRYYYAHPEKAKRQHRGTHLKIQYGITEEHYQALFNSQMGLCAICHKSETHINRAGNIANLAVDHDHRTGKVRGLLCSWCNRALGLLYDDVVLLTSAISYLARNLK